MKRFVFVLFSSSIGFLASTNVLAQPDALGTVARLADEGASESANSRYFFNDLQDSVHFFLNEPHRAAFYTDKDGHEASSPLNIKTAPLCSPLGDLDSQIVDRYNLAKPASVERQNFWVAVGACLAAHEGAEAWINKNHAQFNKLDTPDVTHRKYLFGVFQLSTERGASVDVACQDRWRSFSVRASYSGAPEEYIALQNDIPPMKDLSARGVVPSGNSLSALGNSRKQRFNIMCGIQEVFRASVSGKGKKSFCLSPFHNSQNRFGPLRSQSQAFQKCVSRIALPMMNAGNDTQTLRTAIQIVTGTQSSASPPKVPHDDAI